MAGFNPRTTLPQQCYPQLDGTAASPAQKPIAGLQWLCLTANKHGAALLWIVIRMSITATNSSLEQLDGLPLVCAQKSRRGPFPGKWFDSSHSNLLVYAPDKHRRSVIFG